MTVRPPDGFPLPELVLVSNRVLTEEAEALRAAMEKFRSAPQPGSPWTQDDEAVADRADPIAQGRAAVLRYARHQASLIYINGWSPELSADIIDAGFDLLTWRKNDGRGKVAALPDDAFAVVTCAGDDGRAREYDLADTDVQLTVTTGRHKGRVLNLRQVTRRKPASGGALRQAHILTTRSRDDLPAAAVAWRMASRWREENYFRYGRAHFALDALDSCAAAPDDMARLVPNPAKKTAAAAVASAKKASSARRPPATPSSRS